ncbi:hypothetical protein AQUCO_05000057v1 [Aquilegia coerulea]|uniref:Uncharacterized protein n=1 Tax=Aquilegia coerulea TaxID=218851 RepID=A0A2G5CJB2_AQUCA|nr:hypothetical protein AQUCO_05000057v1 [Aquilegia coerulea]
MPSPSVEVGSNSQRQALIAPQNLVETFDSVTPNSRLINQSVILFNNNDEAVAKGHIDPIGNSQICHGRKVRSGEKKVYITEVLDPNASIYDGPQNGETTILGFVDGGFLIWTESRMQPSVVVGDENFWQASQAEAKSALKVSGLLPRLYIHAWYSTLLKYRGFSMF